MAHSATGSYFGGFAGGLFFGLIGTGIAYAVQSKPDLEPEQTILLKDKSPEYQMFYTDAYKGDVQKKKRSSALVGGLVGTAILVVVIVSASSG